MRKQSLAELEIAFGVVEGFAFVEKIANGGTAFAHSIAIGTQSPVILHNPRVERVDRGIIPELRLLVGLRNLDHLRSDGLKLFMLFGVLYALVPDGFRAGQQAFTDCAYCLRSSR